MAENVNHIVRHWIGSLESYNKIKAQGLLDQWTRYTLKVAAENYSTTGSDGNPITVPVDTYVEYYGENRITPYYPGELLPVKDIVSELPKNLGIGSRYLVGPKDAFDANGNLLYEEEQPGSDAWYIVTIQGKVNNEYLELVEPDIKKLGNFSVRVESYGLKAYVLVNNKLKTYDDIDCGTF